MVNEGWLKDAARVFTAAASFQSFPDIVSLLSWCSFLF